MRSPSTSRRPGLRRLLLATAAAGLLSAAVATTTSATTVPAGDPDATVVVGFVLEPTNLDILHTAGAALDQVLLDNIYETLVEATPSGEISPGLATLEISEDGLTYTLTLQEGVTFHDGDPLTASDVVWTIEQQREGQEAATLSRVAVGRGDRRPDGGADVERAGQRPRLQPLPPRRRRAQRGGDRPRNDRQRHRPVHARRVEPGVVHLAAAQRRLLG